MDKVKLKIEEVNKLKEKTLTVFLTSGFPVPENFVDLAVEIVRAGADILEIGVPFVDSLADRPVIQASYTKALEKNVNLNKTLEYIEEIKSRIDVPILLMGSSNPIVRMGKEDFVNKAKSVGADGLIVPDVPLEEYEDFYDERFDDFSKILLTTPTSPSERISEIDNKSSGFVYCVSVVGITGVRNNFQSDVLSNLERTYQLVSKNKMQIGFGISSYENVKRFTPYCDGVIVGSAIVNSLSSENDNYENTLNLVRELKRGCIN